MKNPKIKELARLFASFFKVGSLTFGGGLAMLPFLERELCERRRWTTKERLLDYYVIGQSTPGIIAVNVATFVGFSRCGIAGAVAATAGIVAPSLIAITAIAAALSNFAELQVVKKCLSGINVAVSAMLADIFSKFAKKSIVDWKTFLIFAASFAALSFLNAPSWAIIASAAIVGISFKRAEKK